MSEGPTAGGTPDREILGTDALMDRAESVMRSGRDAVIGAYVEMPAWQRGAIRVAATATPRLAEAYLNRKLGNSPGDLGSVGVDDFVNDLGGRDAYLAQDLRDARAAAAGERGPSLDPAVDTPPPGEQAAGDPRSGDQRSGDQGAGDQPPPSAPKPDGREAGQAAMRAAFGDPVSPLTQVDPSATAASDPAAKKGPGPHKSTERQQG